MENTARVTEEGLRRGLAELERLAEAEYRIPLARVLTDPDEELAFRRAGRLMAVWLKQPFADPIRYDPDLAWNWAKSYRAWEIHRPIPAALPEDEASRLQLLQRIAQEWDRPVTRLAEFNIFLSACKRLRPVVCGGSKAFEKAEKLADGIRKKGTEVSSFSPDQLLSAASVTAATYLVQTVSFLSPTHLPLVTGATLLICCFGHRKLCDLAEGFEKQYDPKKDRAAGEQRCSFIESQSRKQCANPVRREGARCWIHYEDF